MKKKYRFKIAYKIFIFTILVSFIPISIISSVFYKRIEKTVKEEVISSYEHISQQYVYNVEYKLGLYDNIMGDISSSKITQDFLIFLQKVKDDSEISRVRVTLLEDLNKFLSDKVVMSLSGVTVYPLGNKEVLYHVHLGNIKNLDNYEWIKNTLTDINKNYFYSYLDWSKRNVISFYNVIRDRSNYILNDNRLGLVRLDTYASDLFALKMTSTPNNNMQIIILDGNFNKIYSIADSDIWDNWKENILQSVNIHKQDVKIGGKKYLLLNKRISKYDWSVLFIFDYNEINKRVNDSTTSIIFINMVFYIILFLACFIFSSSMSKRLKLLTGKMQNVKSGILVTEPAISGNDEIAIIDNDFNDMVVKLDNLIEENYIQNIEKKEAELRALRFQINPHFLYNTLELINSMASVYDCDDIALVSQKLGQMFRYNMSHNDSDFTTLREEIDHIQNYYTIEKFRFEDNIKVLFDISNEHLDYKIPRFILQPLVENAFKHGFNDEKTQGKIKISSYNIGEHLYVIIDDDGEGMDKERLEYVKTYINNENKNIRYDGKDKNTRNGIGLYNVNNRLKLYYSNLYGLRIDSIKGKGTKVTIHIPKI